MERNGDMGAQKQESTALVSFEHDDFSTIETFPHPVQKSIMPVIAVRDNQFRPVGTCFAITNHGLLITAKHVVEDALGFTGRNELELGPSYPDCWLQVIYSSDEINEDGSSLGGPLPINRVFFNNDLDIAVMHVQLPTNKQTEKLLRLPASLLSPGTPDTGKMCFGIGYHSMDWIPENQGYKVIQSFSASRGTVEDVYFPLRERGRLRFPCFRTTAKFEGGMSGGPIIGEDGGVIGVVCDDCHGSLIGPAFLIPVDFQTDAGGEERKFLYDAVEGGSVSVNDTINQINVTRSDTELVLDFGHPTRLRNVL